MSFCRNKKELAHPGNKGLDIAVALLKPIKDKYASVTWAGKRKRHLSSLYRTLSVQSSNHYTGAFNVLWR